MANTAAEEILMRFDDVRARNAAYAEPCGEFVKFRELLDRGVVPWQDDSTIDPYFTMHRTHGDGFSVIWGRGSFGCDANLLEARVKGVPEVTGYLTAEEAFKMIREHCL